MKRNAFTLIELLAVIVILAIISLIAVPIIIHIIDDSKKASNIENIKLYAEAIELSIAKNQMLNNNIILGKYKSDDDHYIVNYKNINQKIIVDYNGPQIKCDFIKIYSNGKVYLKECSVNGEKVEYVYGNKKICVESNDENDYEMAYCGNEKFYILNSFLNLETDETIVMMASKNLKLINNKYIQDSNYNKIRFSPNNYWVDDTCVYANDVSNRWKCNYKQKYTDSNGFVYDENAEIYNYVNGYKNYLVNELNIKSAETTLPNEEYLKSVGCISNSCLDAPSWVYSIPYWIGNACGVTGTVLRLSNSGSYGCGWHHAAWGWGVRPIVTISFEDLS